MSSYLTVYLTPKNSNERVRLMSWSRSSDIYQRLYENGVTYVGDGSTPQFTELTGSYLSDILSIIGAEETDLQKRADIYMKNANGNVEILDEVVHMIDSIDSLRAEKAAFGFLASLADAISQGCSGFIRMEANYD